jgi:tetratricopeptide (TPR) repeat protein
VNQAASSYQQADAVARQIGDDDSAAYTEEGLGNVSKVRGELSQAKAKYSEALSMARRIGDEELAAETQVALADLSLDESSPAAAEQLAREAKLDFHRQHYNDGELDAGAALVRCFLAQGKNEEARKEINYNGALVGGSQRQATQLNFQIAAALVLALANPRQAIQELESTLAEARRSGFISYQFEASLALGEIELKSGKRASGGARLQTLERAAKSRGFELVARKALKARRG